MTAHNTFEDPERVTPAGFENAKKEGNSVVAEIPPKSVVVLEITGK